MNAIKFLLMCTGAGTILGTAFVLVQFMGVRKHRGERI